MTKLSFKAADFASSVVVLKDGRCLEVRRGPLTGKAIPDRRTWASEAEWRASFPPADATTRLHELLTAYCETEDVCAPLNTLLDHVMTPEGRAALERDDRAMRSVQKYAYEINGDALATTALRRKALVFLRTTDFNVNRLYDRNCGDCDTCRQNASFRRPLTQQEEDTITAHLRQAAGDSNVQFTILMDASPAISPADLSLLTPEQEVICKKLTATLVQLNHLPCFRVIFSFPAAPKLEVEEVDEVVEVDELEEAVEAEVVEIPAVVVAEPSTTAAEFTDTMQRLVKDLSKAPASCNALSDLLMAAPAPLRDHIRRNHYFLTLLRAGMHQHAGLPSAEAVLTAYTPLF